MTLVLAAKALIALGCLSHSMDAGKVVLPAPVAAPEIMPDDGAAYIKSKAAEMDAKAAEFRAKAEAWEKCQAAEKDFAAAVDAEGK